MEIYNPHNEPYNIRPEHQPLLDVILRGGKVKSITLCKGQMNWEKPELDYTIHDVVCNYYSVGAGWSENNGYNDAVDILEKRNDETDTYMFWMKNIRSFELYES